MFQEKTCTGISRKVETLTTQVVRKSLLKNRREASSKGPRISIVRRAWQKIRRRRRYSHGYTIKLLIKRKKSSSPFFLYSSTPLLIVLCLNLRVGHKAELLSVLVFF
jgi:hypothetical protein